MPTPTTRPRVGLEDLPSEVLACVLSYVPELSDKLLCARVCRRFTTALLHPIAWCNVQRCVLRRCTDGSVLVELNGYAYSVVDFDSGLFTYLAKFTQLRSIRFVACAPRTRAIQKFSDWMRRLPRTTPDLAWVALNYEFFDAADCEEFVDVLSALPKLGANNAELYCDIQSRCVESPDNVDQIKQSHLSVYDALTSVTALRLSSLRLIQLPPERDPELMLAMLQLICGRGLTYLHLILMHWPHSMALVTSMNTMVPGWLDTLRLESRCVGTTPDQLDPDFEVLEFWTQLSKKIMSNVTTLHLNMNGVRHSQSTSHLVEWLKVVAEKCPKLDRFILEATALPALYKGLFCNLTVHWLSRLGVNRLHVNEWQCRGDVQVVRALRDIGLHVDILPGHRQRMNRRYCRLMVTNPDSPEWGSLSLVISGGSNADAVM